MQMIYYEPIEVTPPCVVCACVCVCASLSCPLCPLGAHSLGVIGGAEIQVLVSGLPQDIGSQ